MALESATYISDLVTTNPAGSDQKSSLDDHVRLVKSTLKTTFPNVTGAVTPTHTELNYVDGVTSAIQTQLDAKGSKTGETWTGSQNFSDGVVSRGMLKDCGYVVNAKGNSGTSTQTYDYTDGFVQTSTCTGNHTIATSNWPPTGNLGQILIIGTNFGAYTITWPTINWINSDGTTTTSVSTYLAGNAGRTAFQTSGIDQILLWSLDGGTTIYGKLV